MKHSEVIIIGGGPAGSSCAWKLKQKGIDCIILEQAKFPRTKLCAGWITPEVKDLLELDRYPHDIITFNKILFHIWGKEHTAKVKQHSIRRYELDNWLLKRSKAKVINHKVKEIKKTDKYIIDNKFSCRYLVGAGGTHCPVYRKFFEKLNPRAKATHVVAMEEEFRYDYKDKDCHLWFFDNKLPGYAWYVPKGNGYINIGIGGFVKNMKRQSIRQQWEYFTEELDKKGLITNHKYNPGAYTYYIRKNITNWHKDDAFIIGDALGLATRDLAEGIGPAVESGIKAAEAIMTKQPQSLKKIKKDSTPTIHAALIKLKIRFTF